MSAYWEDRLSGQSGSIGTYSLGDKTLDLWSGNAEVYYTFSVWYNPVIPGGSATMEYRFKCAPATSTPSQQGYSSVRRVYDFNNNGRVDRNDLDYGFQPRYEECVPHAKVSSERCAEIDYDYDGTISIKDFYYFQDKYEG